MPKTRKKECTFCKRYFTPSPQVGSRQKQCGDPDCAAQMKKATQQKWHKEKNPTYFHGRYKNTKACLSKRPGYLKEYRKNNPDYVEKNRQQQKIRDQRRQNKNLDIQDLAFAQDLVPQRDKCKLTDLDIQELASLYLIGMLGLTSKLRNLDIQDDIDMSLHSLYNRGRFLYRRYVDL